MMCNEHVEKIECKIILFKGREYVLQNRLVVQMQIRRWSNQGDDG